jgi:DNA repair ATPase RecN
MLSHLSIRNYLLVESVELDFAPGLTVLTGETGAGKSILVDALALALGDRAEGGVVRSGAPRAEIAAEFDVNGLPQLASWWPFACLHQRQRRAADPAQRSGGISARYPRPACPSRFVTSASPA